MKNSLVKPDFEKLQLTSRIIAQRLYNKIRDDAEKGDANAIYEWGNVFYFGMYDIKPNKETAFSLYRFAARKGNEFARFMLAGCYFDGIGHGRDCKKAAHEFKLLAQAGWNECWRLLGLCYEQTGHFKKAQAAFDMAKRHGDESVDKDLARLSNFKQ